MNSIQYADYQGMLWKATHQTARSLGAWERIEEIHSEANYLFCLAARSYKSEMSQFSTHLFHYLKNLTSYSRRMISKVHSLPEPERVPDDSSLSSTVLETAERELSKNAYRLMELILSLPQERVEKITDAQPCREVVSMFHKSYSDITLQAARKAWSECRTWYRNHEDFVACSM